MNLWRKPFDIDEKIAKPVKMRIDVDRCKGCGYCVEFCPRGVLKMAGELGPKGYEMVRVVGEDECLGCGLCEAICPEFGIYPAAEEQGVQTTHA